MNPSDLRPVTAEELLLVDQGLADFSSWYNAVPNIRPHQFQGRPDDISTADYDFYELSGTIWGRDHGLAMTCTWGNVLVRSFGFQWSVLGPPRDFRDYLLRHPGGYCLFPWQRLWEAVQSPGPQFPKLQSAWLRIVSDTDLFGSLPNGWYPPIDALRGEHLGWPEEAVELMRSLYEQQSDTFFEKLGMWPYEWTKRSDWRQIISWLKLLSSH